MLNKKDYIVKQLKRTYKKEYENYVITRIWHLLNDLNIKIITQQYIKRSVDVDNSKKGFALADLYFPQFNLIVEVDEEHHLGNKLSDDARDRDVINATNFKIERIDTSESIELIHEKIDSIVEYIRRYKMVKNIDDWDYENEFDIKKYLEKGNIDVKDNAIFRYSYHICNCFGYNHKGWMKGGINHPLKDNVLIWFPKLYKHKDWDNQISLDEKYIFERNIDEKENKKTIKKWMNDPRSVRYCFGQYKDNLGRMLYHFKGEYTLDKERTINENRAVWERTNTVVKTINKKQND